MAPSMKLTMRWEEGDPSLHSTFKISLPKGWKDGPTMNLKKTFVEGYNAKFSGNQLEMDKVHLVNPKGEQLADDDIVLKVLDPSDTVRVKPGKPPASTAKKIIEAAPGSSEKVTTAAQLQKMKEEEEKHAFDYSKWDRLDLSDDDGNDCHPNIDLESWKRLMGRQRMERREAEERKILRYDAKIQKYTKKTAQLEKKLEKWLKENETEKSSKFEEKKTQIEIDLEDARSSKMEYEYKLKKFQSERKLVADDLCEVKDSKGLIAENADYDPTTNVADSEAAATKAGASTPAASSSKGEESMTADLGKLDIAKTDATDNAPKPSPPEDHEMSSYDTFQKAHRALLNQFAVMRSDIDSEDFLLKHPTLLSEHAEGFLLILTLDTCIKHNLLRNDPTQPEFATPESIAQQEQKEFVVAKQHLTIHYVNQLGQSLRRKPIEAVKPFFRKTGPKAEDKVAGFQEDLAAFLLKIRARAKQKIELGEIRPLVDPESSLVRMNSEVVYEKAPPGPGGLDPNEVLGTLPETLQEAFIQQDLEKLRLAFDNLPPDEGEYHLKRCIDSGLWVPAEGDYDFEEEFEEDEEVVQEPTHVPVAEVPDLGPTVDDIE